MISPQVITALAIAAACTVLVPIVLLIVLGVKRKISGLPLLIGAAAFFVSQIVLRIPLITMISTRSWYQAFSANHFALLLGLSFTAGLFEESARLGGALLLKNHRNYKDVISFGLGHGLCEVIVLVGLSYVSNLALGILANNPGAMSILPAETMEQVTAQLAVLNHTSLYWGVLERVSAVIFHIFATVLVFRGVIEKKIYYYFLAMLAHTLFNLIAALLVSSAGIAVTEIVLLILAAAMGYYVIRWKKKVT